MAERLKPESLYDRFIEYRESLGFEVLPLTGGERPPLEVLAERLRANRVRVPDGRPRPDPLRRAGGLLRRAHPDAGRPGEAGHRDRCRRCCPRTSTTTARTASSDSTTPLDTESGDVGVITQALADRFAMNIAAHPQDWHMLQPQWLADLSDEAARPNPRAR